MASLNQQKQQTEKIAKEAPIPSQFKFTRPAMEVRVTSVVDRDYRKIRGIITDFPYKESQDICNFKGTPIAKFKKHPTDQKLDELILFPSDLESTQKNLAAHLAAGRTVVPQDTLKDEFVLTRGMDVDYKCGNDCSIKGLQEFSKILIGVSCSRYCTDVDKLSQCKDGKPMYGVSIAVQQWEVKEPALPYSVMKFFLENPSIFKFPLPDVADLLVEEEYVHERVADEKKQSTAVSSRLVYLPILDAEETALLFGAGPGAQVLIDWANKDAFSKKYAPKAGQKKEKEEYYRLAHGDFTLKQWASWKELATGTTAAGTPLKLFRMNITLYEGLLRFKLRSVAGWEQMAKSLYEQTRSIIVGKIGLYNTADNALNSPENQSSSNISFLDFKPLQVVCDEVGEIKRIGVRVSEQYMKIIATNGWMNWMPIEMSQLSDKDQSFLNCNEWTPEGLLGFLQSARAKDFHFYAVLSNCLSKSGRATVARIIDWADKKQDTTGTLPYGEMLLWKDWAQNADDWIAAMSTATRVQVPTDHPALNAPPAFVSGTIVYYAVDFKKRAAAEKKAKEHPFVLSLAGQKRKMIEGPPTTTATTTTTTTSTTQPQVQQTSSNSEWTNLMASKQLTSLTINMPPVEKKEESGVGENGSQDDDDEKTEDDNAEGSASVDSKRSKKNE